MTTKTSKMTTARGSVQVKVGVIDEGRDKVLARVQNEHEKYGVLQVFNGLDLILTEHMILNIWDHDTPVAYLKQCICYQLKRINQDDLHTKFTADEYEMLSSTLVYALVFAKNDLQLNNLKSTVLVNLLWNVFKFSDKRFEDITFPLYDSDEFNTIKMSDSEFDAFKKEKALPNFNDTIVPKNSDIDDVFLNEHNFCNEKNYSNDLSMFKNVIKELSANRKSMEFQGVRNSNFSKAEITKIIDYIFKCYFNQYDLYDYCRSYPVTQEEVYKKTTIDSPQVIEPLEEAKYLGEIITADEQRKIDEELNKSELLKQSKIAKQNAAEELEIQKEKDLWQGQSEDQVKLIKQKVEEARNQINKDLEDKKLAIKEKQDKAKASIPGKKK